MKKLLIMFAAILAAGIVQAAFVDWTINMGKADGANKTYYVFGGSKASDVDAALAALTTESASSLSSWALATGTLNAKAGKASGDGLDVGSETSLYMVVLDSTLTAGGTYKTASVDITSSLYTPPATTPGYNTVDSSAFTGSGTIVAGGGGGGGGGVPEPTSGLLILVGGALIALRRKQA